MADQNTPDPRFKEVIIPAILERTRDGAIFMQDIVDELEDFIVEQYDGTKNFSEYMNAWTARIHDAATLAKTTVHPNKASWKAVKQRVTTAESTPREQASNENESQASGTQTSRSQTSTQRHKSLLKMQLNSCQKANLEHALQSIDNYKDSDLWILKSSSNPGQRVDRTKSVEHRIRDFALKSQFFHPSESLILDLEDAHLEDVFTNEELKEIEETGAPIIREVPASVGEILSELGKLHSPKEAYLFAQAIKHDPISEPLKAWISMAVMSSAYLFLYNSSHHQHAERLEADRMYHIWGFFNSVFKGSNICAIGKEMQSAANTDNINRKRRLSTVNEIARRETGLRADTIYMGGDIELGCMETGSVGDDRKTMSDGFLKLPIILRDQLLKIINKHPSLLHQVHVIGYNLQGNNATMIDMDIPEGRTTRIRRTTTLSFPSCSQDFIVRIVPLLKLAIIGKVIMEDTQQLISSTPIPLTAGSRHVPPILVPTFVPFSDTTSPSPTSSEGSTASTPTSSSSSSQTGTTKFTGFSATNASINTKRTKHAQSS